MKRRQFVKTQNRPVNSASGAHLAPVFLPRAAAVMGIVLALAVSGVQQQAVAETENAAAELQRQAARFFLEGNYDEAFPLYLKLSIDGDKMAQYRTAYMYHDGLGGEKNLIEAFAWATMAAEITDPNITDYWPSILNELDSAMFTAAFAKALDYFQRYSVLNRGQLEGDSLQKKADAYFAAEKYKKALSIYRPTARTGNKYSQYRLATMYQNGFGVAKDAAEAYAWASLAAEFGTPPFFIYMKQIESSLGGKLAAAKAKAVEYYNNYSTLSLAEQSLKKNKRVLARCSSTKASNNCFWIKGATFLLNGNAKSFGGSDRSNQLGFWDGDGKYHINQIAGSRAVVEKIARLQVFARAYMDLYGNVTLGEFEMLDDEDDHTADSNEG